MLEIVLGILKIAGIIFVAILGILIVLICFVLFVPARYRGDFSVSDREYGDGKTISAKFRGTWLLRLVRVYVTYEEAVRVQVKLFFFTFLDTAKEKRAGKRRRKREKPERKKDGGAETEREEEEKKPDSLQEASSGEQERESGAEPGERERESGKEPGERERESGAEPGEQVRESGKEPGEQERESGKESAKEAGERAEETFREAASDEKAGAEERKRADTAGGENGRQGRRRKREKKSIKSIFSNILQTIRNFCDKLRGIREKAGRLEELWASDHMVRSRGLLGRQLGYLLRHTKPKELSGYIRFGFEDPSATGYVMAAYGILYPIWSPKLSVEPDFERQVLECHILIKGRIRVWHFVRAALRMILSKDVRRVIRDVKSLQAGTERSADAS